MYMSACCVYDFTSFEENKDDIRKWCDKWCKKWTFQQEECPSTGNLHFQGRISLKTKKRANEISKDDLKFHFTVTSKANRDNDFYCCKEDTRMDGPWRDDDEKKYETRQIKEFMSWELRPYQIKIKNECQRFGRKKRFDRPRIFVFTNELPNLDLMSNIF